MSELYLGIISGTSVDSIDVALVDFAGEQPELIASYCKQWPQSLRRDILATRSLADDALDALEQLDLQTADAFAEAANECLQIAMVRFADVIAIGSHGQTIRHRPDIKTPFSMQIGNAARIAELTGIDVISDFRSADIEAGGQGAPLVPAFHQAVFSSADSNRVIVNIGGVANITVLADGEPVTGFDTGPGNTLMDAWADKHGQHAYDVDGEMAARGTTDAYLLARCLTEPYFSVQPPKSTGFELFNMAWLEQYLESELSIDDVQSTLCDLTATSILRDINRYAPQTDEIFVCGGGAHNRELMRRLQAMAAMPVASTQQLGVHPDWVEAMTFAWLARQNIKHQPGNIPSVTGAGKAVVLGTVTTWVDD